MDFFQHLKSYLSDEEIEKLRLSLRQESKHAVLLNPAKMDDKSFLSLYPNVIKHPIVNHAYLYDKNEYDLGKSIYHALGCFYLQEPSAMIPAFLLSAKEGETILDLCAAPGGKTIQTSFLMNDTGVIISNDLSKQRTFSIIENEERLGLGNIIVTNNDFSLIYDHFLNTFDRIILDAPCSGSGMFRKEEKMFEDWSYNKVLKFAEVQKQLIQYAYQMLKPGGTLCYSTCSFSLEEDEDVIQYLLDNTDAEVVSIEDPLFYQRKEKPLGIHLFPFMFPGEGHYICLIKKPGILSRYEEKLSYKDNQFGFVNEYRFGDYLFGINQTINTKYLNIVRLGVKIGESNKGVMKYDYHYAHYVKAFANTLELNDQELALYMSGNVLPKNIEKGYYLLKYKGINVDIAKCDGKYIKNNLPKGLRIIVKN